MWQRLVILFYPNIQVIWDKTTRNGRNVKYKVTFQVQDNLV